MPKNNHCGTIGVILPRLGSYFITSAVRGIAETANASGYEVVVTNSQESFQKEAFNARLLLESGVDGVVASLVTPMRSPAHYGEFADRGIPVVFFDRVPEVGCDRMRQAGGYDRMRETGGYDKMRETGGYDRVNADCDRVTIDNTGCGYIAAEHLIRQGCKRIAFISCEPERQVYAQRYHGYLKALESYGVSFAGELIVPEDHDEQAGSTVANWITGMKLKPDGLFIPNDLISAMCIQALTEAGVRIPEDIAVVGFNNDPIGRFMTPTLTTIDYPGYEIGKTAAGRLLGCLAGNRSRPGNITILSAGLVVRSSSLKKKMA